MNDTSFIGGQLRQHCPLNSRDVIFPDNSATPRISGVFEIHDNPNPFLVFKHLRKFDGSTLYSVRKNNEEADAKARNKSYQGYVEEFPSHSCH